MFAGNRAYVLRRMLSLGLNVVKIWVVRDSYLERYLNKERLSYTTIESKGQLCDEIDRTSFDYFISNGLPIILPISELRKKSKQFINIHPSLLPDLRGCDPIPGALLFHRDSGATCHVMDDGIDTGGIISQIKIPMTDDLDAGLLYQLSFMAEADVFEEALKRGFAVGKVQEKSTSDLYYSYKEEDSLIDPQRENADAIFDKVRAFSTRNKSARVQIGKYTYTVINAFLIINPYANRLFESSPDCHVLMVYENSIVLKIKGKLMTWQIECEKLYEESKPQFPIIGSVIKKIGGVDIK